MGFGKQFLKPLLFVVASFSWLTSSGKGSQISCLWA